MESQEKLADKVCRLCLKYNTETRIPLFENGSLSYYGQAVLPFAKINLVEDSDLPHSMCLKCLILLQHCISFKFMCEDSDLKLKKVKNFIKSGSYIPHIKKESSKPKKEKYLDKNTDDSVFKSSKTITQTVKEDPDEELNDLDLSVNDDISDLSSDDSDKGDNKKEVVTEKRRIFKYAVNKDKDGRHVCPICNLSLGKRSSYVTHMQRHEYGKRFVCEHCGKNFSTQMGLQGHLLIIHRVGKGLKCPHCPYKAPQSYDLKEHIRIHTGERPFTCEQCGLTFRRKTIFRKHLLKHDKKTVKCERCPKMFYRRSDMLEHFNNAHERQYMYACSECGILYSTSKVVRQHLIKKHGIPREKQKKILRVKTSDHNKSLLDSQ